MFFNKSAKLLKERDAELQQCNEQVNALKQKYSAFIDQEKQLAAINEEISKATAGLSTLNQKYQDALAIHNELEKEINLYRDSLEIGSFGLYEPQFNFETSEHFKNAIELNFNQQKSLIKNDLAVVCHTQWEVAGSKTEGRKMTNQYKKLMLFAFNGECDGLIAKVKWNNALKTKERIQKAFENINKLGVTTNTEITADFLRLKLEELALTYEYEQKKYEEKEEQRQIREQMREEEKAQKELEKAQREAEDEERRYQKALDKAKSELGTASQKELEVLNEQITTLEKRLAEAHERKERAIAMAQFTKVGHIYVISNIGSFGEHVYKIGMTRRLDPLDRIRELGDASVPFHFDVHAIIYSENAPQLEYELHKKFSNHRLNRINNRKEFFHVTLEEIETFVKEHANAEIEFTRLAEAREYRETLTLKQIRENQMIEEFDARFPNSLI
jgi:hypothetical protein